MFSVHHLKTLCIKKRLDRFAKSHLVLLDVDKFFPRVPLKLHGMTFTIFNRS